MEVKNKFAKTIVTIARIVFGITFIFSGFVKAVDPLGFTYKIEDYLISFQLTQLIPFALAFAITLILIEFVLGVFILIGIYRKWTSSLAVLFMVVMTPLTLYIALANPVKDCGCFGDALIISNWSTFYKNIVLLVSAIILFVYRKQIISLYSSKTKSYVLAFVILFFLAFSFYNIIYLPVLDFRPYKVGSNIPEKMGHNMMQSDVYENIYVYEKEGVTKEFTDENYPWEDTTWTFVELKSNLIEEGDKPEIQDFAITAYYKNENGAFNKTDDITHEFLSKPFSLLIVSLSLNEISDTQWQKIQSIADYAANNSIDMRIGTSSDGNVIEQLDKKISDANLNYASMDELTLKTIIRSNPGLLLLKEGAVQAKWSKNRLPDVSQLNNIISSYHNNEEHLPNNKTDSKLLIICLLFAIPLLGLKWYDKKIS